MGVIKSVDNAEGHIEHYLDDTQVPNVISYRAYTTGSTITIFEYRITRVVPNISRTLYCWARVGPSWGTLPTSAQFYLQAEYPTTVGNTATVKSTTTPKEYWNKYEVTFIPTRKGTVTLKMILEVADGTKYVEVEPQLYVFDERTGVTVPDPALVIEVATLDAEITDASFDGTVKIEVLPNGNLICCDYIQHDVKVFDPSDQSLVTTFGTYGSGTGEFIRPDGLAVDGSGNIFVVDSNPSDPKVLKFNSSFVFVSEFDVAAPDAAFQNYMSDPSTTPIITDIAFDSDGYMYIVDNACHRVVKCSSAGVFIQNIGRPGSSDGQLAFPVTVDINDADELHVCNGLNRRVEVFDTDGNFIRRYGESETCIGGLLQPHGVAFDADGNSIVTDASYGHIQVFDSVGTYQYSIGDSPATPDSSFLNQRPVLNVTWPCGAKFLTATGQIAFAQGGGATASIQLRTVVV